MKTIRRRALPLIILLLSVLFSGCDKLPENGDLDGLWQLMSIQNGGTTTDMKAKRMYCSFQLKLFMLGNDAYPRHFFGYFEHKGSTMRFHHFTFRSDYVEGGKIDELMTDETGLKHIAPWGFYSTDCTFNVVKLNSSELILEHGDTKIVYRKF